MLLSFCQWVEHYSGAVAIRESMWGFAILIAVHVLSLGIFLGTAITMDLRLLGKGVRTLPVSDFVERLLPWTRAAFAVMALSGALLFITEAVKCYHSQAFRLKLLSIALAGVNIWIFHKHTYISVAKWDTAPALPTSVRLAAGLSLLFWMGALAAGRAVGYDL